MLTYVAPLNDLDSLQNGKRWDVNVEHATEEVKQLGRSKWSNDNLDEDDTEGTRNAAGGKANSLSGLIQAYGKEGKSVHWADQVCLFLFSLTVCFFGFHWLMFVYCLPSGFDRF